MSTTGEAKLYEALAQVSKEIGGLSESVRGIARTQDEMRKDMARMSDQIAQNSHLPGEVQRAHARIDGHEMDIRALREARAGLQGAFAAGKALPFLLGGGAVWVIAQVLQVVK